jgi:hypothetical protein
MDFYNTDSILSTRTFFVQKFAQSQNVTRKNRSYEKRARRMLMKLTRAWTSKIQNNFHGPPLCCYVPLADPILPVIEM